MYKLNIESDPLVKSLSDSANLTFNESHVIQKAQRFPSQVLTLVGGNRMCLESNYETMIRMDSSKNNTGYVDYIMDYPVVLVPLYPSRMSSLSPLDTKIKLCFPKKDPPWTLPRAYKTI